MCPKPSDYPGNPEFRGREVTPDMAARVKKAVEFAKASLTHHTDEADGILISFHVVKGDRITHYFEASDFPVVDWGNAMISMGYKAHEEQLRVLTARDKE